MRSYSTKEEDEVSVPIGSVVEVLRKTDDGWWFIRYLHLLHMQRGKVRQLVLLDFKLKYRLTAV